MIIRKKTKGNKTYYYLEHSIRKENKIIKKEKYLGTSIPKNIEKVKEEFNRSLKIGIYDKFEKIKNNFQAEWKRIPESVKEKELEEIGKTPEEKIEEVKVEGEEKREAKAKAEEEKEEKKSSQ